MRTDALKQVAAYLCREAEGVKGVENHVISDTQVVRALADALAGDAVTRPWVIRVEVRLGKATLLGIVPSIDVERRALEVAAAVPLALGVESEMEIDPQLTPPSAEAAEEAPARVAVEVASAE